MDLNKINGRSGSALINPGGRWHRLMSPISCPHNPLGDCIIHRCSCDVLRPEQMFRQVALTPAPPATHPITLTNPSVSPGPLFTPTRGRHAPVGQVAVTGAAFYGRGKWCTWRCCTLHANRGRTCCHQYPRMGADSVSAGERIY